MRGEKFLLCTSYDRIGIPDYIQKVINHYSPRGRHIIVLPTHIITSDNAQSTYLRIYKEVQIYKRYEPLQDNLRTADIYLPIRFEYMIAMVSGGRHIHIDSLHL